MSSYHTSVLLKETIHLLRVASNKQFIDATIGGGGHSIEIIRLGGEVLGIDVDEDALRFVKENYKLAITSGKLKVIKSNFKDIERIAEQNGFKRVSGILFDLGISGHQLDIKEKGFSFRTDAVLDMRMDRTLTVTAADLVNGLTKGELYEIFTKFGEEHFARRISEAIVRARQIKIIKSTYELSSIVRSSIPRIHNEKIHPETRVFQALRIAVNDELNNLRQVLPSALALLNKCGRIAVISFHSLEDRIVKTAFLEFESNGFGKVITKKPIIPVDEEIADNPRSRSAKLRIFEKI